MNPPPLALGRAVCTDLAAAETREWLVTNGLGGFASGTLAGTLTRRYHGLLFAALRPPVGRTLLCPKLDAEVEVDGVRYALAADRWGDGTIAPRGYVHCAGFALDGRVPCWTYVCGDAVVERRIWMEHDANRTYVQLRVVRARGPLALTVRAFANHRDLHATTRAGDWRMEVEVVDGALRVRPFPGAAEIWLRAEVTTPIPAHAWYRDFAYPVESERGLDDREDHLCVGTFAAVVAPGAAWTTTVADAPCAEVGGAAALAREHAREQLLLESWAAVAPRRERPAWVERLVLAADQFVVRRTIAGDPDGRSVIAGYHWFGDWGRDTAIALPGLTLAAGRPEVAGTILRTFAGFVDGGMLPNDFPDDGRAPEYNTADAALWYVEAVRRYVALAGDAAAAGLFPAVAAIVAGYEHGTRFGIAVDPADGLVRAGVAGVQLTWMDGKVDDWVVTPRIGKPVEINALWIAALRSAAALAPAAGADPAPYVAAAVRAERSFERFWNGAAGCCYDVVDGPSGDDPSVRPNQILAVALPIDVLDAERRRAIVDLCASRLWTPAGLRSLDPQDPRYVGRYGGDRRARDGGYHQGTVWAWLAGPYALAHFRAYGDAAAALGGLQLVGSAVTEAGLGTLGEIADGDPPFAPRGAIAQAWSVGCVLDAWSTIARAAG